MPSTFSGGTSLPSAILNEPYRLIVGCGRAGALEHAIDLLVILVRCSPTACVRWRMTGWSFRHDYGENPPRVEYGLTELGRQMMPIMDSLADFGAYYKTIASQRACRLGTRPVAEQADRRLAPATGDAWRRRKGRLASSRRAYKSSRSLFVQRAKVPSSTHLLKKSHSHQRSNLAIAIMEATTSFASALDMS